MYLYHFFSALTFLIAAAAATVGNAPVVAAGAFVASGLFAIAESIKTKS